MHFFSALHFQQISFTLLHFKLTHSMGAQGEVERDGVWSRDARVTYNLGWVKYKKKTHNGKTRRKLQTGHVQKCTNTFQLDCVSVCV